MSASLALWRDSVIETKDGCLVWQGRIDPNGYARIGGKWAHRVIYEKEIGPIREGLELDHLCCNPPCVNPKHLDPITKAEHVARTYRRNGADDKHFSAAYLRTIGLTYNEIAESLGYMGKGGARDAVKAAVRKGLVQSSEIPAPDYLDEQDRQDIADLRAIGIPVSEIARWYQIDRSTASRLSRGIRSGQQQATNSNERTTS